jgi:hypothetical protein
MAEMTGIVALVIGIIALLMLKGSRDTIRLLEARIEDLARQVHRLQESSGREGQEAPSQTRLAVPDKVVSTPWVQPEPKQEIFVPPPADVPVRPAPKETRAISDTPKAEALHVVAKPETPAVVSAEEPPGQPPEAERSLFDSFDRERWATWEARLGKQWMTWVGAVVLFLSVGFFVKYAFEHKWLGEGARVILGVVAGIGVLAAGERFIRRQMRALGQGLVGAGLAILYVSLFAAYGLYGLLPQSVTFLLMAVVTAGGVVLAVIHDAVAVSFLAVLGGFLTPVLLRTGRDPRDALFAYLLLLDLGVLGVAFFKRWRALDVLAFLGTAALFTGWYFTFRHAPTYATVPTVLWLAVFYVVFLIQPFIYHLRLATPIVGERFFLAVSNAAGMFSLTYTILHAEHKHVLGLITLGMSASYLVLGSLTRKRLRGDERAVFGFIALSVLFLTIAIPIHLDFDGVTVAWAAEAPVLLYLAYKYLYFPVRAGVLIVWALAAGRIFTIHWPWHETAFTPIVNSHFGTAIFVALAGGAYTLIHHWQRKNSSPLDRMLKLWTGIVSAFLALAVLNIEVWQWLDLSHRGHLARWACALWCAVGAAAFLGAGIKLPSVHSRICGLVALAAAGVLEIWDYSVGIVPSYALIFNGRFLAALAVIVVLFSYAFTYRRLQQLCLPDEQRSSIPFYGTGILLLILVCSGETWQWLAFHDHRYIARCLLPLLWVAGTAGYLGAGLKLRSLALRKTGLAVLAAAGILAGLGYAYRVERDIPLLLSGRFVAALAVPLMAFAYAFVLRRWRDTGAAVEQQISQALYGIGIFLLVILMTAEMWLWLDAHGHEYLARCLVPLIWVAGAAGYLGAGFRLRSFELRTAGLAVLAVAGMLASTGYAYRVEDDVLLVLNGRFAAALAVPLMAFLYAFALRRLRDLCDPIEQRVSQALYGIAVALLVILATAETWFWLDARHYDYLARCLVTVIWVAGAAAYVGTGIKLRTANLRYVGLVFLTVAGFLAARGYTFDLGTDHLLYLNGRLLAALSVVLMIFAHGFILRRFREEEQLTALVLYGIGIVLLFVLLNVETYLYFRETMADRERARWASQMSLSVTWGTYAIAILAIGFWRNVRILRLAALGLFGLTALKLVVVDMAKVHEVYRIVSFLVLGVLMIGASYLYHRVEKRLGLSSSAGTAPSDKQ